MGREIRRVPEHWEHPKDERTGRYKPLLNRDYESEAEAWQSNLLAWNSGVDVLPDGDDITKARKSYRYYWEYAGNPPNKEYYRPSWSSEEATHYQIYETVSEGTPVSPVFATLDAMFFWLVNTAGYSTVAADRFVKTGWAMSAVFDTGSGRFAADIETLAMFNE